MQRLQQMKSLQKFASVHQSFYNLFNSQRHLVSRQVHEDMRSEAFAEWQSLVA